MISPTILSLYEADSFMIKARAELKDIEDYIELWHNSNSMLGLPGFLGMTYEEYKTWVENGTKLKEIVNEH